MGVDFARRLRRDATEAEKVMWRLLRSRQLAGAKFRRQQPIDHYVVDFVSLEHRLVIEVDGGQHASDVERDDRRTAYLEAQGFRVLRFWNNDVLENREGVYAKVVENLASDTPHPSRATRRVPPSPARGEG